MKHLDWNKLTPLLVLLLITIFTFVYVGKTGRIPKFGPQRSAPQNQTPPQQPTPSEITNQPATITGSVSYPSEVIPPDLQVCAQSLDTQTTTCTSNLIQDDQFQYGLGYQLELIPNLEYQVYAQVPNSPTRAYYSEYVTCGLNVDCLSHEPITINLTPGQTLTGIDPADWYAPAPTPTQTLDRNLVDDEATPEPQL